MSFRVMVVDDDPTALVLVKGHLERLEAESVTFTDSRLASEGLAVERYDLFIVDARMPHVDGFELTRRIRSSQLNGTVPVVMLTASDDGQTMREGFKAGITFFLGKPVNFAKLRGLVETARGTALKERRRHVRIPFQTAVDCRFGQQHFQAQSVDLGGSGMAFRPSAGLEEGQILELSFLLPGNDRPLRLQAKVLRKEPPDGVAVEFVDLPPEERSALKDFFAALMQSLK
jgi:CheY-like chemotaxis protein